MEPRIKGAIQMIDSKYSGRAVSLLAFLPVMLTGLKAQENVVPLKNWSAPLYWQPNQAEREAAAKALAQNAVPQFQLSANAVSTEALTFVAITPCRLVDTRGAGGGFNGDTPFSGPSITGGGTATFPVQSSTEATANTTPAPCGVIPSIAQAYSFNLTVIPQAGGEVGYVTLWPAGGTRPVVATLNDRQGLIVNNAAIVAAGTPSGGVSVFNDGPTTIDVIIDMNGFFTAPTDLNFNTAVGAGTLASNTTGVGNTATGADALGANTTGNANTALGNQALLKNTTGGGNTATGQGALSSNTGGYDNTANGADALLNNTTGGDNTALGEAALGANTTGSYNTATGYQAMLDNTTGTSNTANGYSALSSNTTGSGNTVAGTNALQSNTTGNNNTANGSEALNNNTTGFQNTASGNGALLENTTGNNNTASGALALEANTIGASNTASGYQALQNNTTGGNNIAIGYLAANNAPVANSNSIYIGSTGSGGDTGGVIYLGTQGTQTGGTYIAGISGATASSGAEVYVTSSGQLGTVLSSGRFKEQITDMGDTSSKLLQLRPVSFFYKPEYDDGSHLLQYGLIAEEVAKVYPEMVAYDHDGKVLTVKYHLLTPMLLNEAQKQHAEVQKLSGEAEKQNQRAQQQDETIRQLQARLAVLEALLGKVPTTATAGQ
jgi:Chaperone of endosialidase